MKKIISYVMIGVPIALSATGIGIYYAVKSNATEVDSTTSDTINDTNKSTAKPKQKTIFPNVTFDELYDDIRVENKEVIIPNDMVSKFIKIVLMRMGPKKNINVKIFRKSSSNVDIKFSTNDNSGKEVSKIYSMKLMH